MESRPLSESVSRPASSGLPADLEFLQRMAEEDERGGDSGADEQQREDHEKAFHWSAPEEFVERDLRQLSRVR